MPKKYVFGANNCSTLLTIYGKYTITKQMTKYFSLKCINQNLSFSKHLQYINKLVCKVKLPFTSTKTKRKTHMGMLLSLSTNILSTLELMN